MWLEEGGGGFWVCFQVFFVCLRCFWCFVGFLRCLFFFFFFSVFCVVFFVCFVFSFGRGGGVVVVLMVDDEMCFFFSCGTATNVRLDGLCGILRAGVQMQLSTGRRLPSTATPRGRPPRRRNVTTPACRGRVASGQGSLYCTWSRGPDRAHGARCSAFAESSRSCGTT